MQFRLPIDVSKLKQTGVVLTPKDLEEIEQRKKTFLDGTDKGMNAATSVKRLRELIRRKSA